MTRSSHNNSKELYAKASKVFPGGVSSPVRSFRAVGREPFVVKKGSGPYLIDHDDNRYIDYVCSWGPLVLGHGFPSVVEAIAKQAELGTSYGACSHLEEELAEIIKDFYPSMEMLRFVNSGTEAGMSALRLARGFTGRDKVIKFTGCYHGHADPFLVKAGSGSMTLGTPNSAGVPAGAAGDTLLASFNNLEEVEQLFSRYPGEIAAVILEPAMGNSGLILPKLGFLDGLRKICSNNNSLLVFDEVMTGFRADLRGVQGLYGITPDLVMLGKVIGGGLPVAAFGGRREIMESLAPLGPVYQAGTLSGNPLGMVAGIATLREWCKEGVFERTAKMAKELIDQILQIGKENGFSLQGCSLGSMFGFFFSEKQVSSYEEALGVDQELFKAFFSKCLDREVYFAPSAFEAGFLSAAHTEKELQNTVDVVQEVFKELRE